MMSYNRSTTGVTKQERLHPSLVSGTGRFAGRVHFIDFVRAFLVSLPRIRTAAGNRVLGVIVLVVAWRWITRILAPGREWYAHRCRFLRNAGLFVCTQ